MSNKLKDKIALITGGTEGIGLATANLFAKEGAYVFITGRRQKELDEAVRAIGTNVSGVQGDVAQLADLDRLYETVSKVKGRIDIVFANAGVGEFVPFGAVTEEHFDKLFNTNVRGTLFTVQKALPLLKDGGCASPKFCPVLKSTASTLSSAGVSAMTGAHVSLRRIRVGPAHPLLAIASKPAPGKSRSPATAGGAEAQASPTPDGSG